MTDSEGPHRARLDAPRSFLAPMSDRSTTRTPLFVTDRVAPRRRRPSDAARLVVSTVGFVLVGWASSGDPPLDRRVIEFFDEMPDWIRTIAWFGFAASGLVAFGVALVGVVAGGVGRGLARDVLAAGTATVVVATVASHWTQGVSPDLVPEVSGAPTTISFPMLRTALVVLVASVLGPYVNAQVQRWMRWTLIIAVTAPITLGLATVTSVFGAVTLSVGCVAAVRLIFGSPEGLPAVDRLSATLDGLGIAATEVAYLPAQPGTVALATARAGDGTPIDIKLYGIDAANSQRAERVWKALWYRTAGPSPRAGRIEQAQHEALAVLLAREAGAPVPPLIGAGQTPDGDVLMVSGGATGSALDEVEDLDDDTVCEIWRALVDLHERAHLTHGNIGFDAVRILDGRAEFVDFSKASMFPTEQQLATDLVSMLAMLTIGIGEERALATAVATVPRDVLEMSLPYVQDAVLEPALRSDLKATGTVAKDLHAALAEHLDIDTKPLASVRRVKVSDVVIAIAAIVAANALITQISDVGVDTLVDEVSGASPGWMVTSFLVRMSAYATAYIGLRAVVSQPLPFLPTTLLQSAKSFVGLVVPSLVGSVSMNIRFLQNLGVPLAIASTQGPVIGFIGFIAEVVLLLLCSWAIGQEVAADSLFDVDVGGLILLAIGVSVVGCVVVFAVPKLRSIVLPAIKEAVKAVRMIVTSPRTLSSIFASEALDRVVGALALGATIAAFGESVPFAALVFVSVGTGLLAGLAPVPGGIGVAEATMTALLTAVGLAPSQAVTIAITHRVITSYLPPVFGFFSLRWLNREGFL
ncbi:MAG: YbhN family protein [Ilumatobacter sp.]